MKSISKPLKLKPNAFQYFSAYSVFLSILIITLLIGTTVFIEKVTTSQQEFESNISDFEKVITSKIQTTTTLLESARATFTIKPSPTSEEFRKYADLIRISDNKSILGIGYVARVKNIEGEEYDQFLRIRGIEKLSIFPSVERKEYYPIIYIQPMNERNMIVLGYDMTTEEARRTAMEKAKDSGELSVTGKVHLLQEINIESQSGIIMFYPLYSTSENHSVEERRANLSGYIYVPIRVEDFIGKELTDQANNSNIKVEIYTGPKLDESTHIYSLGSEETDNIPILQKLLPKLSATRSIKVGDSQWTIKYSDDKTLSSPEYYKEILLIWYHGLVTSVLVLFLNIAYMKSRAKVDSLKSTNAELTESLFDSKKLKQDMLDSIQTGIIALNKQGIITHVNKTWLEYFKDIKDESGNQFNWLGLDYLGYIYKQLSTDKSGIVQKYSEMLTKVLKGESEKEKDIFTVEQEFSKFWIEITISLLKTRKGGVLVNVSDITTLKQLEKQKEDFLGIASHELKTPLTTIKAYSQILKSKLGQINPSLFSYADRMNTQVDRLSYLITQLLEVSRLVNGKLLLSKSIFDLCDLAKTVISDYEILEERKINLHYDTQCIVEADRDRITQVITNLINNALKYSKEKDIDVFVLKTENEIKFSVRDYGDGIDSNLKENLFERFFQVGPQTSKNSGLGLGLYISKQIINGHGGTINFISVKGDGTTFFFTLPVHEL